MAGSLRVRHSLRRWHIWLGWIVGIPFFVWTASGLIMVWRPIEEVRGTHLLKKVPPMRVEAPIVLPAVDGVTLKSLSLERGARGPRWVAVLPDGTARLADPATGQWLPSLSANDAAAEVMGLYTGTSAVRSVSRTDPDRPPLELRHAVATWQVALEDGTHFYVDANSGMIHAKRTRWWRLYDFMWGLHIMDPVTREDTHNPWIIGFSVAALVTTLLALIMLPLTIRRRRRASSSAETAGPPR
jgi:hypothetical protein